VFCEFYKGRRTDARGEWRIKRPSLATVNLHIGFVNRRMCSFQNAPSMQRWAHAKDKGRGYEEKRKRKCGSIDKNATKKKRT